MSTLKKMVLPAVIIAVGLSVIGLISVSKPEPSADQDQLGEVPRPKVLVIPARREVVTLSAFSQGSVTPKREIELVSQVAGTIIAVEQQFEEGAFFDTGSLLIEIDDRDYQAAYQGAWARVAQAERVLAEEEGRASQAEREWRDLGASKANDLFLRKPQLIEATANLASVEAQLQTAELNLERTRIRAPFNGRINETRVDLGQYVTIGTPLAKVYDIATAEVRLPLSDRQLAMLDIPLGLTAEDGPGVKLSATIAGRTHQWQGLITRTEASIDTQSRLYYAIVEVDKPFRVEAGNQENSQAPLMPGLFVSAEIAGKNIEGVLVLPRESLVRREYIYTLDDSDTITVHPVTVLKKDLDQVWLQADIEEATLIVIEKHALLSPGTAVDPVTEVAGSGSGANNTAVED
ncbi:MAG: RND family efflux transporter MFP subunit [Halieaceae bacterium]|jgi:RND family efflux transporter MFP subunit